jgi:beta-N-acetylhexosaminidase
MSATQIPLGPVLVAVDGLELSVTDRERARHPLVGGIILFAPNFSDCEQLTRLCADIHSLREPRLLICVDHEGGRVQRFRDGFTRLPPMRRIGELWDRDPVHARDAACAAGLIMAMELRRCGVDLSLAPVLDVDHGASKIIGDRAFHSDPAAIADLAGALLDGMGKGGMAGVGKHFPGHGYIAADSHLELPVDERSLEQINACDLMPFRALAHKLAGVMPAHVLYPQVDARPAGYSPRWIRELLREELGFQGAVFSDDLGMAGAAGEGSLDARAHAAFHAGCDLVLACTAQGADAVLSQLHFKMPEQSRRRLVALLGGNSEEPAISRTDAALASAREKLGNLIS